MATLRWRDLIYLALLRTRARHATGHAPSSPRSSHRSQVIYDDGDKWTGEAIWIYVLPPHHPGNSMKVPMGAPTMDGIPGMAPGGGVQMGTSFGPPVMGAPPGGGMEVLTVVATVPGGQTMQLQGPAGPMNVQVPLGVQPGQQFQFQAPAAPAFGAPPVVLAQPIVSEQVVLARPV